MLIAYLKSLLPQTNSNTNTNQSSRNAFDHLQLTDFEAFYKKAKKRFDEDLSFQQESRQEVVRLQSLDPESLQYWSFLCEKSRQEFQSIYQLLNIHQLIERGESFYNRRLPSLLMRLQAKGLLSDSQQAKVMYLESFPAPDAQQEEGEGIASKGFPLMLQKSDGGYLYATTDLAALDYRIEEDRADKIVYVTDAGQATHFQMIFEAARKAGILSDQSTRVVHVPFGLVLGENGKRMKTRAGGNVKLKELLSEAIQRCEEEFRKREQEKLSASAAVAVMMSEEEIRQRATVMGMSAVKYADLSMNRETNYRFSFDKMLSLQGNTAPYMLYTFSRIRGIQRKALETFLAGEQGTTVDHRSLERQIIERALDHEFRFESPQEHRLAKVLLRADDILFDVEKNLYPHRVRP
jgi:arginyl-tRNA synthetase